MSSSFQAQDFPLIADVYGLFDTPLPAGIGKAQAIADAAADVRAAIYGESEPSAEVTNAKDAPVTIARIADWHANIAHRRAASDRVAGAARGVAEGAWFASVMQFHADLSTWFGATVERFDALLAEINVETDQIRLLQAGRVAEQNELVALAAKLTAIRNARRALQSQAEIHSKPFTYWSAFATQPDLGMCVNLRNVFIGDLAQGTKDIPDGTPAWWQKLASVNGVSLKYSTPAQQQAMHDAIRTRRHEAAGQQPTRMNAYTA